MTEMFRRITGACGLAFVVVFVILTVTSGEPSRTASTQEIVAYFSSHQTGLEVSGAVAMLVSGIFALFAVGVWTLLRSGQRGEGRAWPVAALVGAIVMSVNLALLGATFAEEGRLGASLSSQPILAMAIFTSEQTLATSIVPFIALFTLGVGMASLESGVFPQWTAWLGFLGAALSVALLPQLVWPGRVTDGIGIAQGFVVLGFIAIVAICMLLPQRQPMTYGAQSTGSATAR